MVFGERKGELALTVYPETSTEESFLMSNPTIIVEEWEYELCCNLERETDL